MEICGFEDSEAQSKVIHFGLLQLPEVADRLACRVGNRQLSLLLLVQAADAYAFGILMWELYTCSRAWANLTHVQVCPCAAPATKSQPHWAY